MITFTHFLRFPKFAPPASLGDSILSRNCLSAMLFSSETCMTPMGSMPRYMVLQASAKPSKILKSPRSNLRYQSDLGDMSRSALLLGTTRYYVCRAAPTYKSKVGSPVMGVSPKRARRALPWVCAERRMAYGGYFGAFERDAGWIRGGYSRTLELFSLSFPPFLFPFHLFYFLFSPYFSLGLPP